MTIPKTGRPFDEVLKDLGAKGSQDLDYRRQVLESVYYVDDAYYDFLKKAHNSYFSENLPQSHGGFQSLKTLEDQVVRMTTPCCTAVTRPSAP